MIKITYSRTITSLRGLSVLGVLLYHSKFELFEGGFLGVDVFFVISGYLIGNIIFSQLIKKEFKFSSFYYRRIRRLFPAVLFTIIFTYVLHYFVLLPDDFNKLKDSILYVLTFTGNIYFWQNSDYFSTDTDILPLSHLWSLSVEEQFYLLFPIIIYVLVKSKFIKKYLGYLILSGIVISFLYISFDYYHLPLECPSSNCVEVTNFYWLHTRFWELLAGVLLNFFPTKNKFSTFQFYFGLSLIVGSFIIFNSNLTHPGVGTLPTILGTVLVIHSSRTTKDNILSKSRILYFLGKISYSLYLIHFPLFVSRNYLDLKVRVFKVYDLLPYGLIIISIIIGFLMWKYIEEPFRSKAIVSDRFFLTSTFFLISFIFILVSPLVPNKKLNSDYENYIFDTDFEINRECFFELVPADISVLDNCFFPKKNKKNILIIGSSLAQNIYKGFELSDNDEFNHNYIAITGCPPFMDYEVLQIVNFNKDKCKILYDEVLDRVKLYKEEYYKILIIYNWREITSNNSIFTSGSYEEILDSISSNFGVKKILILGQPVVWENQLKLWALREINFNDFIDEYSNSNLDIEIFESEEKMQNATSELEIPYFSLLNLYCLDDKCKVFEELNGKRYFISQDFQHITNYFSLKLVEQITETIFKLPSE